MERYMLILKSIKRMNPELEQTLRKNVYPITVQKNEIFQVPFARLEHLYFIEKGLMRYYINIHGEETTVEFKQEDQFVIGLKNTDAYQTEGLGIEALEESTLWCFPGNMVKELLEKQPRFHTQYYGILNREFSAWGQSVHCRHPGGGASNLDNIRHWFPNLLHRIPLHHLASYTQTPERTLRHLLASPLKLYGARTTRHRRKSRGAAKK
jgi:hypothetical protein